MVYLSKLNWNMELIEWELMYDLKPITENHELWVLLSNSIISSPYLIFLILGGGGGGSNTIVSYVSYRTTKIEYVDQW